MLRILEAEELAVGEVAKALQLAQSTVSRQLKVLADGGWIEGRNVATATLYRMKRSDDLEPLARQVWAAIRGNLKGAEFEADSRRLAEVVAARPLDSKAFFGRVVGEWDEMRRRLFGVDFTARALMALLPREWVVADLGCGTGNATKLLAPQVQRVIAVDSSDAMLDAARSLLAGAKNVEFVAGELERLPLKDGSVDAAVCVLVLHHLDDPGAAIAEMGRIVRRQRGGGLALVVDMVEHGRKEFRHTMGHKHLGFAPEQIAKMFRAAGFRETRVDILPADPEAKGPTLFAATGRV
jgi:ArsR family transcriptional regulator